MLFFHWCAIQMPMKNFGKKILMNIYAWSLVKNFHLFRNKMSVKFVYSIPRGYQSLLRFVLRNSYRLGHCGFVGQSIPYTVMMQVQSLPSPFLSKKAMKKVPLDEDQKNNLVFQSVIHCLDQQFSTLFISQHT